MPTRTKATQALQEGKMEAKTESHTESEKERESPQCDERVSGVAAGRRPSEGSQRACRQMGASEGLRRQARRHDVATVIETTSVGAFVLTCTGPQHDMITGREQRHHHGRRCIAPSREDKTSAATHRNSHGGRRCLHILCISRSDLEVHMGHSLIVLGQHIVDGRCIRVSRDLSRRRGAGSDDPQR